MRQQEQQATTATQSHNQWTGPSLNEYTLAPDTLIYSYDEEHDTAESYMAHPRVMTYILQSLPYVEPVPWMCQNLVES